MAKTMGKAQFAVVPTQFDLETEEVQAYAFDDSTQATAFAQNVQAYAKRQYATLKGLGVDKVERGTVLSEEDKAERKAQKAKIDAIPQGLALDILIQMTDSSGAPTGDPAVMSSLRK